MKLRENIQKAVIQAMKDRDSKRLAVLRMVMGSVKNADIDAGEAIDDVGVQVVIKRQVKQLKDAMKDFSSAGREDLVEQNQYELSVLEEYLPAQLSDMELNEIVKNVISDLGAQTAQDLGKVMGPIMDRVQGNADGTRVRNIVLSLLS